MRYTLMQSRGIEVTNCARRINTDAPPFEQVARFVTLTDAIFTVTFNPSGLCIPYLKGSKNSSSPLRHLQLEQAVSIMRGQPVFIIWRLSSKASWITMRR